MIWYSCLTFSPPIAGTDASTAPGLVDLPGYLAPPLVPGLSRSREGWREGGGPCDANTN